MMRQGQTGTTTAKWDDLKVFLEVARQVEAAPPASAFRAIATATASY